jgi:hypothetical protein
MIVKTEKPENKSYRRFDAGVKVFQALLILLIFGWVLIPLYTAGFLLEFLGLAEYQKKGGEN